MGERCAYSSWVCKERTRKSERKRHAVRRVAPHLAFDFVAARSQIAADMLPRRAAPKAKCGATNAHPICEQHTSASVVFVAQTASLSVSLEIVAAREDFFNHGWTRINTDEDGVSLIRVHPCSSVVGSYWLRLGRAALYRGLPTRWPFAVPTPRRLAIGDTAGWQPALRNSGSMGSLHPFFRAHWDHEPRRVRSAGFRACATSQW